MAQQSHSSGCLIALDWGTTNVRAALLDGTGMVLEERRGESGVGHYSRQEFEARFDGLCQGWPIVPVIAAGMVGSRQGWYEASYLPCPNGVDDLGGNLTRFEKDSRTVAIVPGLKTDRAGHVDVMRGEETQIAGLLALKPGFDGTVVLPGTHSKWVQVRKGVIEYFTTYMTGEMFDALAKHTILRHSVDVDATDKTDADKGMFAEAVSDVFVGKGSDLARLFHLRASTLLQGADNACSREQLSGTLIGMELKAAAEDGYDVQSFVVIGSGPLIGRYHRAGHVLGAEMENFEGTNLIWPALFSLAGQAKLLEQNQ